MPHQQRLELLTALVCALFTGACTGSVTPGATGVCVDEDGDGYGQNCENGSDCDDTDGAVFTPLEGFADSDGDGFTVGAAQTVCTDGSLPDGFVASANGQDCDDADAFAYPGAAPSDDASACMRDADGDDFGDAAASAPVMAGSDCNDADGAVFTPLEGFADSDGDGFTVGAAQTVCTDGSLPDGFLASANGQDCDDADAFAYPGAAPTDDASACMRDADGDDFGDAAASAPVMAGSDCDDTDPELFVPLDAYLDTDGDGYAQGPLQEVCTDGALPPWWRESSAGADCDDADARYYAEVSGYVDADYDNYGAGPLVQACADADGVLQLGYAEQAGDCNDTDPSINPRANERPEPGDEDCDSGTSVSLSRTDGVFVDGADPDCDDNGDATPSTPACSLNAALALAGGSHVVFLARGTYDEGVDPAALDADGDALRLETSIFGGYVHDLNDDSWRRPTPVDPSLTVIQNNWYDAMRVDAQTTVTVDGVALEQASCDPCPSGAIPTSIDLSFDAGLFLLRANVRGAPSDRSGLSRSLDLAASGHQYGVIVDSDIEAGPDGPDNNRERQGVWLWNGRAVIVRSRVSAGPAKPSRKCSGIEVREPTQDASENYPGDVVVIDSVVEGCAGSGAAPADNHGIEALANTRLHVIGSTVTSEVAASSVAIKTAGDIRMLRSQAIGGRATAASKGLEVANGHLLLAHSAVQTTPGASQSAAVTASSPWLNLWHNTLWAAGADNEAIALHINGSNQRGTVGNTILRTKPYGSNASAAALSSAADANLMLTHNLLWAAPVSCLVGEGAAVDCAASSVMDVAACGWAGCLSTRGTLAEDPRLEADGVHLATESACIDAGSIAPWSAPATAGSEDIDGDAVPRGEAPDIGADEH